MRKSQIDSISNIPFFLVAILAILSWLPPSTTSAAPVQVQAVVDRNAAAMGESIQMQVTVGGVHNGDVDVSPIRDFKVMSRGTSTSIRIVNGNPSRDITFNYTLIPLKTGQLRIPPLTVKTPDGNYQTREITVTVSQQPQQHSADQDIFVSASVSDQTPYVGEQIIYTFQLRRAVRIANAQFQKPAFSGFTAEQIGEEQSDIQVIHGRRFHVTTLSYALIPLNSGTQKIQPAALTCDVIHQDQRGRRSSPFDFDSIFGDPFFSPGRVESRVLHTQPVTVQVRPLPEYQGDQPFSGLVGRMDIRADLATANLATGDSTTLTIVVQGTGNIMDAQTPVMDLPDGFKVYEDAPQERISLGRQGYVGEKTFKMALVPLKPGKYRLPPVQLTYFNTETGTYQTRQTNAFDLTVRKRETREAMSVASAPSADNGRAKQKVIFTGRDILPIKDDLSALEDQRPLALSWFLGLLAIPAILSLTAAGLFRITRKADDPASVMARRARSSMKKAAAWGVSDNELLSCLYRALVSAILSKAGTTGESLTWAEAKTLLDRHGVADEVARQAAELLEQIETAKFGGSVLNDSERKHLLAETREILGKIS